MPANLSGIAKLHVSPTPCALVTRVADQPFGFLGIHPALQVIEPALTAAFVAEELRAGIRFHDTTDVAVISPFRDAVIRDVGRPPLATDAGGVSRRVSLA